MLDKPLSKYQVFEFVSREIHCNNSRFLDWSGGRYIVKGQERNDIGTFLATCSLLFMFVIFSAG